MAITPLATWQSTLAALPPVADSSWALNFSTWYFSNIATIQPDPSALVPSAFTFPFPVPLFAAQLQALPPTPSALAGIMGFAAAWETAILATIPTVAAGSFVPPPTPPTTFSAVISVQIDPASIAAGKAKLLELVTAPPVANAMMSDFPVKFREATLLLTITVTGINSAVPVPTPFVASNVPLI